jgi:hypothetical protein
MKCLKPDLCQNSTKNSHSYFQLVASFPKFPWFFLVIACKERTDRVGVPAWPVSTILPNWRTAKTSHNWVRKTLWLRRLHPLPDQRHPRISHVALSHHSRESSSAVSWDVINAYNVYKKINAYTVLYGRFSHAAFTLEGTCRAINGERPNSSRSICILLMLY